MRRFQALVLAALGLLFAGQAAAQTQAIQNIVLRNSFNPLGAGARGLGMGGAFIAVADDGTAASFNPAGLAQLRRSEFAIVGFHDTLTTDAALADGAGVTGQTLRHTHSRPDFAGLSVPFEVASRNLTVELAYQRTIDLFGAGETTFIDTGTLQRLGVDAPGQGFARFRVSPRQAGAFETISAAGAYQVTSRLALGTAINYWFSSWDVDGEVNRTLFAVRPDPSSSTAPRTITTEIGRSNVEFTQQQSFHALSVNLGLLLKYPKVSLGGVLRLPFTGDYDLQETNVTTVFTAGGVRGATTSFTPPAVKSRLHWPRSAGAGISLRPVKGLTLAGDYTKSLWSRTYLEDVPSGALLTPRVFDPAGNEIVSYSNRNFFDLQPASESPTVDTSQWRAGGEYLVTLIPRVVVPVRGGIFRDRSPVASGTAENEGREIKGWTAGIGVNFSRVVFDVAYERRTSEGLVGFRALRREGDVVAAESTSETVRETRILASMIYRFGDDDPVQRALRYLFVGGEKKEDNQQP